MRCPACGHANRPDRRFCAECGAAWVSSALLTRSETDFCGISASKRRRLFRIPTPYFGTAAMLPSGFSMPDAGRSPINKRR